MSVFPTVSDHRAFSRTGTTAFLRLRELELYERHRRVAQFLEQQQIDGLWLTRRENIVWYASTSLEWPGAAHPARRNGILLIDEQRHLIVNEDTWKTHVRLFADIQDQLRAELHLYGPAEADSLSTLLSQQAGDRRIGADSKVTLPNAQPIAQDFARLRLTLSPTEQYMYRLLSRDTTHILQSVARGIRPQQSEREIAAEIAHHCYLAGIQPTTLLVSADSGIRRYRHPSPRENAVTRYAILVLTGTRGGMHAGLTRIVAVDRPPARLEDKHRLATTLNAISMAHTAQGRTLEAALTAGLTAFESTNHPADWRVRFRGEILDYKARDMNQIVNARQPIENYQAIAWATAINGVQAEDTILVLPDHNEVLTNSEGWPVIEIEVDGTAQFRPDILRV